MWTDRLGDDKATFGRGSKDCAEEPLVRRDPGHDDPSQLWAPGQRTRVAVVRDINIVGRLSFNEPVAVEGRLRGEVRSTKLIVIAEGGMIEGKVSAPHVLVVGAFQGEIAADRVELGPRARVCGNIETHGLTIREGAVLDGHVRMPGRPDRPMNVSE